MPLVKVSESVFNHYDNEGKYWGEQVLFDLFRLMSKPYGVAMSKLPWEWAQASMRATLPYLNQKLSKLKDHPLQLLVEDVAETHAVRRRVRGVSSPGSTAVMPSKVLRYLADLQDVRFQMLLEGDINDLQIHLRRVGAKRGLSVRLKKSESWQFRKTGLYSCGGYKPAPPPSTLAHVVSTLKHRSQFLFLIKSSLTRS